MNHGEDAPAYWQWAPVLINAIVFILFTVSFFTPKTKRDRRTFGGFSGFIIALFADMQGFPLTIYLLSGWLARWLPRANLFSPDTGHLWYERMGFTGHPRTSPIHLASSVFIIAGFLLLAASWQAFFSAQKAKKLATVGPYSYVRHPQYAALIVIMLGFLLHWPTLITLIMFPILAASYARLARREEGAAATAFGQAWMDYARSTPRWFPSRCLPGLRGDGIVVHFWGR